MMWRAPGVPAETSIERFRRSVWFWLVPLLSFLLTVVAWQLTREATVGRAGDRFRFRTRVVETGIRERLAHHGDVLRGLAGLFDAGGEVTLAHWSSYLDAVEPRRATAGLLRLAFVEPSGAVAMIYPVGARWPSLDGATGESALREAMTRARDEGTPALSRHVRFVTEGATTPSAQAAVLLCVPVFSGPAATVAERSIALRGFVVSAIGVHEVMADVFDGQRWDIDVEVFDGDQPLDGQRLYRSAADRVPAVDSPESLDEVSMQRVAIDVAGRRWLLLATPSDGFLSAAERNQPWLIALGGVTISVLFGVAVWASTALQGRALALAAGMAHAARVTDAQTQLMVDSITDHAIFRLDRNGRVASWNSGAERMLGYSESAALSMPALQLWADDGSNPYVCDGAVTERRTHEGWHLRKDGERFWGVATVAPLRHAETDAGYVVILRDDSSRRTVFEALAEASAALEQRTFELGRFNRLASGRELRMIELKRMVNERSVQLGMSPPFDVSFANGFDDVRLPGTESS
jgi:PAS domain S-box-containing protein